SRPRGPTIWKTCSSGIGDATSPGSGTCPSSRPGPSGAKCRRGPSRSVFSRRCVMTDRDEMYQAFVRDRRRLIVVFVLVLAVIAGTLGTGWALSAAGRAAWADQALTWQERYVELYDEFTTATGEKPDAPEPGVVAEQGPQGEPGDPGPPGPAGPAGRDAS